MDDPADIIKNFEDILKKTNNKEPLALYKDQRCKNSYSLPGLSSHSAQDVISRVSMQIKAMQKADVVTTSKQDSKKLYKYRKSTFLPVNKLAKDVEVPPKLPAPKFETQFECDTQLLHLIDNAEAFVNNNGITQEFDRTFSQTHVHKIDNDSKCHSSNAEYKHFTKDGMRMVKKSDILCEKDKFGNETDSPSIINDNIDIITHVRDGSAKSCREIKPVSIDRKCKPNNTLRNGDNCDMNTQNNDKEVFISSKKDILQDNTQLNDNCIEMFNKSIEIETNLNMLDNNETDDEEIEPSLVFEVRPKYVSPMVFDLGTFENFEKIAAPILEENTDLKSAKQLINSQIIGKELCIESNLAMGISLMKEQVSPVLKISGERLRITKTANSNMSLKDNTKKNDIPEFKEETFLKDEILFSSDEENEYLHKEFQDIPLTCALETSFYEQPDMLDKTLYVGFQTASNRSIQISRESFSKARSILGDAENDESTQVTFTELVKTLSAKKDNTNALCQSKLNSQSKKKRFMLEDDDNLIKEETDCLKRPQKRKLEGFVTASRKKIKLSDIALARCKRVFQDIDLNDDFDMDNYEGDALLPGNKEENFVIDISVKDKENIVKPSTHSKMDTNPQLDDDILQEFAYDMSMIDEGNLDTETYNSKMGNNKDVLDEAPSKKFFDSIDFSDKTLEDIEINHIQQENTIFDCAISNKTKSVSNSECVHFKTASNNQIKLSLKALGKAKTVFPDIDTCEKYGPITETRDINGSTFNIEDFNQPSTSKGFDGFKTASNKNIKVSHQALIRSKSILQDIISNVCKNEPTNAVTEKEVAFNSANNRDTAVLNNYKEKPIKIQSETNVDSDKEFDDDLNEVFNTQLFDIEKENLPECIGFKTASNKPVNISEKALVHSKNVFKDLGVDDDSCCDNDKYTESVSAKLQKSKTRVNTKTLNFNKESKSFGNMSKPLSNSQNDTTNKDIERNIHDTDVNVKESFLGFQTASKKPINISHEALAKSKKIFHDIDAENFDTTEILKKSDKTDTVAQFPGFKTGNNKVIAVSAKCLAKGKEIFKDINDVSNMNYSFQTANNKPIHISTAALAQSKVIFKDINDISNNEFKAHDEPIGFRTASKKPIQISGQALAKSKQIFKDIDNDSGISYLISNAAPTIQGLQTTSKTPVLISTEDTENMTNKVLDIFDEDQVIPTFQGFQTASKNPVKISATALARSKALFQDIDKDFGINEKENFDTYKSNKPAFKGFQTASKKSVKISAQPLLKSKAIFDNIDKDFDTVKDNLTNQETFQFKGFETASNKPVISAEALAKSKAIFEDIDQENAIVKHCEDNDYAPMLLGFQTASKKLVTVSEEAVAKSKALFKDIGEDIPETNLDKNINDVAKFKGFEIASKKPVHISAEALAKSKALFKDIDLDIVEQDTPSKDIVPNFRGFQTASKKPVQMSAEALAKSKTIFKDIDQDIAERDYTANSDILPKFIGFETASKKPVHISKEALAKSKAMFNEIDKASDSDQNLMHSSQILGFQTACNKSVKVSEDALIRSKRLFDDIDSFKDDNDKDAESIPFRGFETASNKIVKMSEEALTKTINQFQDSNFDSYKNIDRTPNYPKHFNTTDTGFKTKLKMKIETSKTGKNLFKDNEIENLVDTQVLNNFEQTLCTEDFSTESPKRSKRSGSPILSCPRPKKRKFNTPYSNNEKKTTIYTKTAPKHDDILFNADYKKTNRYTLKHLAKVEAANIKIQPDSYILNFNFNNILEFQFDRYRNDLNEGKLTIDGLKDYFLSVVNKKFIPNGWLDNHLKLILWKLISYEVKFTQTLNRVCTAKNVIEQLKYRYDKELYNVERPILRKILEKDEVASKTMVLCVAGIIVDGVTVSSVTNTTANVELLLTDGWYTIMAVIDKMLTKLVYDEKITVGCKIVTNGAELMNCEQGVAPWEDTSSVRLKISGNSTRRARWDARLGCHGNAAILTKLSSVKPEGGKVSKLRLYVTRVYPMLYVEKFEDGSTVTRSERLENIHQIKYESDRQTAMEKLYEEVEKELSDQITESQTKCLEEKSNKKREKILQNIQERVRKKVEERGLNVGRNIVTLLKIRVAGVEDNGSGVVATKGFMSIWKPNDMLTEIIKEDSWIEVMNVIPTAIRYSEINLSAGRQSIFMPSKYKENDKIKPHLKAMARRCYPVGDLSKNPTMTTDYNEIDTVGFIFQIDDESTKQPFQNMYLCDGETNIICINFWGGLKKFGFQNLLDTGQIISCSNLQKRAGNTRKSIPQFRVTEFSFFTKTPKNLVARNMIAEIEKRVCSLDKKKYVEDCIKLKNNYSNKAFTENVSPYRFKDLNLTKNKVFIDSPLLSKVEDLNLTGLDFESTFRQTETHDLSPKSKERKKKVNEKIARLKMVGEPPALSPINIINKSKNAFNSYKSPIATGNYSNKNDPQSSPIIKLNRTLTKNVNPVKLNFSNAQENSVDEIDHFAEEFDGSPPLSLE